MAAIRTHISPGSCYVTTNLKSSLVTIIGSWLMPFKKRSYGTPGTSFKKSMSSLMAILSSYNKFKKRSKIFLIRKITFSTSKPYHTLISNRRHWVGLCVQSRTQFRRFVIPISSTYQSYWHLCSVIRTTPPHQVGSGASGETPGLDTSTFTEIIWQEFF